LFITGLHLEQYRHATRCPTLYWREALRRDPLDSRCNNAHGLVASPARRIHRLAEKHFRNAIERLTRRNPNPHDGEPYYNLGLCLRYLGRDDEAYDAFYKSVLEPSVDGGGLSRAGGNRLLPEKLDDRAGTFESFAPVQTLTIFAARNLKAMVLRMLGREDRSLSSLLHESLVLDSAGLVGTNC
jgi:tetratricopeptide (TPR) repeat protein